jgi:hypothetical protein
MLPATASPEDALLKPPAHPYLMLWVDRDVANPYEPFFVTDEEEHQARTARGYVIGSDSGPVSRYHYSRLAKVRGRSLPIASDEGPDLDCADVVLDEDVTVELPAKRARQPPILFDSEDATVSKACSGARERFDRSSKEDVVAADEHYIAAVKAAAKYNETLSLDRERMQRWYTADALEMQQRKLKAAGQNDDGESSRSD